MCASHVTPFRRPEQSAPTERTHSFNCRFGRVNLSCLSRFIGYKLMSPLLQRGDIIRVQRVHTQRLCQSLALERLLPACGIMAEVRASPRLLTGRIKGNPPHLIAHNAEQPTFGFRSPACNACTLRNMFGTRAFCLLLHHIDRHTYTAWLGSAFGLNEPCIAIEKRISAPALLVVLVERLVVLILRQRVGRNQPIIAVDIQFVRCGAQLHRLTNHIVAKRAIAMV